MPLDLTAPATEVFRVTAGRVGATHRTAGPDTPDGRTLCGRPTAGMHRMPADPWDAMGWRSASAGPCLRCASK